MSKITRLICILMAGCLALTLMAGCQGGTDPINAKKDTRDAGIAQKQNDAANPDK